MADDQQRNPNDPWVAPPLGSDGASSGAYTDPFAQQPAQPTYAQQPYAAPPSYAPQQGYAQPYVMNGQPGGGGDAKNWMGITSLVLSILGISLGGVIFGHLGLGAAKRGEANNRGIALAGTIVGWIGMAAGLVFLVTAFALPIWLASGTSAEVSTDTSYSWEDDSTDATPAPTLGDDSATEDPYASLGQPGDGVFGLAEANEYFLVWVNGTPSAGTCVAPSLEYGYDLDVVDCASSHVGEVYYAASLADVVTGGDLTTDEAWAEIDAACAAAIEPYADTVVEQDLGGWYFAASDDAELTIDDTLLCVTSYDFSETTGAYLDGSGGTVY